MSFLRPSHQPLRLFLTSSQCIPRSVTRAFSRPSPLYLTSRTTATPLSSSILLRAQLYSSSASKNVVKKPASVDQIKQKAKSAAERQTGSTLPERLLIYHAGTGRVTFLAMFKVTTLFVAAFFSFAVIPAYVSEGRLELEAVGFALCGVIPMLLIGFTTSPFVTHMHIHLPTAARASRQALERFVHTLPPTTPLTLTTMSFIGKPRYSKLEAGHLRPQRSRLGLVNYSRDYVDQEAASRKWYNLRAVNQFYVQDDAALKTARKKVKGKKSAVEWWIWDAVRDRIAKRAATAKTPKA